MKRARTSLSTLALGLSLTAALSAQNPTYTSFGTGCPGALGIPLLSASGGDLPSIGEIFQAEVTNIPFPTAGIGINGLSNTLWDATPLPFDMVLLGMPGCLLLTELRFTRILTVSPGLGT